MFSKYIPIHIIPNKLNEEDFDIVIEEIVNIKDVEKSDTEIQTYESIEEVKFPQEYESISNFILDDLKQKEIADPRVQAMLKRSRHNNLSFFKLSQDYYDLRKKTIRCNGIIFHTIEPHYFRDVKQSLSR